MDSAVLRCLKGEVEGGAQPQAEGAHDAFKPRLQATPSSRSRAETGLFSRKPDSPKQCATLCRGRWPSSSLVAELSWRPRN
jgi:hypothetical protein